MSARAWGGAVGVLGRIFKLHDDVVGGRGVVLWGCLWGLVCGGGHVGGGCGGGGWGCSVVVCCRAWLCGCGGCVSPLCVCLCGCVCGVWAWWLIA